MANWEKLNRQFKATMERLTAQDWQEWERNRMLNRELRRLQMITRAEQQEVIIHGNKKPGDQARF